MPPRWYAARVLKVRPVTAHATASLARLSVVVPVGPGDQLGVQLQTQLSALPQKASVCVVVSERARLPALHCPEHAATTQGGPQWRWLRAPAGRAGQQNAGACVAGGDWLWFLHADAQLLDTTLPALARFIAADHAAIGYFDLRFLGDGPPLMWLNAAGAWLRSRWLRMPFGDQGLCLPRSVFHALGGFDCMTPRGEDHQLVWRARAAGFGVLPVGAPLYTSARRYVDAGWLATTRMHLAETWRQALKFSREGRVQ